MPTTNHGLDIYALITPTSPLPEDTLPHQLYSVFNHDVAAIATAKNCSANWKLTKYPPTPDPKVLKKQPENSEYYLRFNFTINGDDDKAEEFMAQVVAAAKTYWGPEGVKQWRERKPVYFWSEKAGWEEKLMEVDVEVKMKGRENSGGGTGMPMTVRDDQNDESGEMEVD